MKPHIQARQGLLKIMAELSSKGIKSLPGERALCEELDVSLVTVKRTIKQLAVEGRVIVVPRKGNFISDLPRSFEIGLVMKNVPPVSLLRSPGVLAGILEVFFGVDSNYRLRMIQLRDNRQAPDIFNAYELDACIWYLPDLEDFDDIRCVAKASTIPILTILYYELSSNDIAKVPEPNIMLDFLGIGRLRAEFLLNRGHRNIACSIKPDSVIYCGFRSAIAAAGAIHKLEWNATGDKIFNTISSFLDEGHVTAMTISGPGARMESVCQAIDAHPAGDKIELLLDYSWIVEKLALKHPRLKIVGVNTYPGKEMGIVAANAIISLTKNGMPFVPSIKLLSKITRKQ